MKYKIVYLVFVDNGICIIKVIQMEFSLEIEKRHAHVKNSDTLPEFQQYCCLRDCLSYP